MCIRDSTIAGRCSAVRHAVAEPSGMLALGTADGGAAIIDVSSGTRTFELPADGSEPVAIAIAPAGNTLALASRKQVRLWSASATAHAEETSIDESSVAAMAFSL